MAAGLTTPTTERAKEFLRILKEVRGNRAAACRRMGIGNSCLQYWRKKPDFAKAEREICAAVAIEQRQEFKRQMEEAAPPSAPAPPTVPVKDPYGRFLQVWRETLDRAEAAREAGIPLWRLEQMRKRDDETRKAYHRVLLEIRVRQEDTLIIKGILNRDAAAAGKYLAAHDPTYQTKVQVSGQINHSVYAEQVAAVKQSWLASFAHGPSPALMLPPAAEAT